MDKGDSAMTDADLKLQALVQAVEVARMAGVSGALGNSSAASIVSTAEAFYAFLAQPVRLEPPARLGQVAAPRSGATEHAVLQGDVGYVWHQDCPCDRCKTMTECLVAEQRAAMGGDRLER
jgi:hypothetical protein